MPFKATVFLSKKQASNLSNKSGFNNNLSVYFRSVSTPLLSPFKPNHVQDFTKTLGNYILLKMRLHLREESVK